MELTTEITKVFGQEMAKLFTETLNEEEMKQTAEKAWRELNNHEYRYGERQKSQLEVMIDELVADKVVEKVKELLQEPQNKDLIDKEAKRIVFEARKKASDMMIDKLAEGMVEAPFINWNIQSMTNQIASVICNSRNY